MTCSVVNYIDAFARSLQYQYWLSSLEIHESLWFGTRGFITGTL